MTRRQWLILGSLAVVVIALFIALVYVLLTAPSGTGVSVAGSRPQETYAPPAAAVTAQGAYALAREAALGWKGDAYLTSASVSWPKATVDAFGEPVPWVFQFYSPTARKVNVISVDGEEARSLRESYAPYALSAVAVEAWQVDSPQALAEWLNAGGGRFLRAHTLVDVHGALRHDKSDGRLVWYITGLDSAGEDAFSHAVKAGS